MPERVDPVRHTLDTLRVDPAAREDRPYLETMLRRLGYSEAEIQRALGDSAPVVDETPSQLLTDERIIEIEYTGPGLRDFIMIEPADETEFGLDTSDPHGLGAGLTAGEEVLGGGPSMEEVDALVANASEDDWNDWGDTPPGMLEKEAPPEEAKIGEDNPFEDVGQPGGSTEPLPEGAAPEGGEAKPEGEGQEGGAGVEFGAPGAPETPAEDEYQVGEEVTFQSGHELVEFEDLGLNRGKVLTPPKPGSEAADAAFQSDAPQAPAEEPAGEWPAEAGEVPFRHEEWSLYTRDVELSDGRPQKVYFFSKGEPKTGDAAGLPEGYEVAVNERTGLPYLRRVAGEGEEGSHPSELDQVGNPGADTTRGPPRKRVRMVRVRGGSREEAERKVLEAGKDRSVIRSVPIDIKGGGGAV